jgi:hypothetical protein
MEWSDPWATAGEAGGAPTSGRMATSQTEIAALDATLAHAAATRLGIDPRLTAFRARLAPTLERLARAFAAQLRPTDLLAALLRLF